MADARTMPIWCLLLAGCTTSSATTEPYVAPASDDAAIIGEALEIRYDVLATRGEGQCALPGSDQAVPAPCYEAEIRLSSGTEIDLSGSEIYFSQVEPVAGLKNTRGAVIEHVNGDLHRIGFPDDAGRIGPQTPLSVPFIVAGSALNRTKFLPNYYVVDPAGNTAVIDSTREVPAAAMGRADLPFLAPLPADPRRGERDINPLEDATVTFRLNEGVEFAADAIDSGIIPAPQQVEIDRSGSRVELGNGLTPTISGLAREDLQAAFDRLADLGVAVEQGGLPLAISVNENLAIEAEGYELSLRQDGITIRASDSAGAFYALQSLAALLRPGRSDVPALEITDAPRFDFRGMQIDIARNFHGADTLRALIDQMAAYKLNKLHLHLADDEGWRLEIEGLPELTGIGARRCHDPAENHCLLPQLGSGPDASGPGTGYLSAAQYRDLLRYAKARHIEIIPALDMPGHARAAVKAMEARYRRLIAEGASEEEASEFLLSDTDDTTVYRSIQHYSDNTINVCRASAYRFTDHILGAVIALHKEAGVPLNRFHIGADETAGAWGASPLCREFMTRADTPDTAEKLGGYFVARVARMVAKRGLVAAAWSDGLSHADADALPAAVQSNIWGTLYWDGAATAHDHANRGWDVVLSLPDALYFDFPYAAHPEEGGYYWAARRAPTRKLFSMMPGNLSAMAAYWKDRDGQPYTTAAPPLDAGREFVGLQGQIWTETVRDAETLGYQIFPRLFALAERAWHLPEWEVTNRNDGVSVGFGDPIVPQASLDAMQQDWNRFASILAAKELPKLEATGWSYRLPVPGARVADGRLEVSTAIPGLRVECLSDGHWVDVSQCRARGQDPVIVRTISPGGQRHSRIVTVDRTPQ